MNSNIERDTVRSFIMNELTNGVIKVGERLSLPYFAEKLGCSVTPIREALTQLEYAGVVVAVPNRGFLIPELNVHEAKNIYEIIAALELLAMENSLFKTEDIECLKQANNKFSMAIGISEKIKADFVFHDCLTKNYDNPIVHQKLRDIKIRIFSYESRFMGDSGLSAQSADEHTRLITTLEQRNMEFASKILKQNWYHTLQFIQQKIRKPL